MTTEIWILKKNKGLKNRFWLPGTHTFYKTIKNSWPEHSHLPSTLAEIILKIVSAFSRSWTTFYIIGKGFIIQFASSLKRKTFNCFKEVSTLVKWRKNVPKTYHDWFIHFKLMLYFLLFFYCNFIETTLMKHELCRYVIKILVDYSPSSQNYLSG